MELLSSTTKINLSVSWEKLFPSLEITIVTKENIVYLLQDKRAF